MPATTRVEGGGAAAPAPVVAPGSPRTYRARVRMYRHGLGDCFLLTLPRAGKRPFNILIDCGVLGAGGAPMKDLVGHIRDTVGAGRKTGKARLDLVVATHEHKDHLSGFNQARDVFEKELDIGAVWLGWTENLTRAEVRRIKQARRKAASALAAFAGGATRQTEGDVGIATRTRVDALLGFNAVDAGPGARTVAEALEYLKVRGKDAGDLHYLEPGGEPLALPGVAGVRVYVLGPPRDPILLKESAVTERMKQEDVVYHLSRTGVAGVDALSAATAASGPAESERFHPFAPEHRITRTPRDGLGAGTVPPSFWFSRIRSFVASTYDDEKQSWRRIDEDWLSAFGQLALDLDNDTNNTSLVHAIEFVRTGEVLLFVGDAQVGSWRSWEKLEFTVPGRARPLPAHELLARTVFYKVGHHCSHNATLKKGGLELMNDDDLVAFIPLDEATAHSQGKGGWDMPAKPLYETLLAKTRGRTVISDAAKAIPEEATRAGVRPTATYVDWFLK